MDINPKITRKYNIGRVPAIVYIKNYNAEIERAKPISQTYREGEEYYAAYGAAKLSYALETINKEAKSDGLKRLIKALNSGGFFNKQNQTKDKQ